MNAAFEEMHRAAALLMEPGSVYELRIPKAGREKPSQDTSMIH